jgi:hypothetical protein
MRSAAREPAEEPPPPERPELEAMLAEAAAEHRAAVAALQAALREPGRAEGLRLAAAGLFDSGIHLEEARGELAAFTLAAKEYDHVYGKGFEDGQARERAQAAREAVPGPRHRRASASRQPGPGQMALSVVKGVAIAAVVGIKPLLGHARHAVAHPATIKLTAHTAKLAAMSVTGAVAAGVTTAYLIAPAVTSVPHSPTAGAGASVPGWHTSASPFPSGSPVALLTKPKPRHSSDGKRLDASAGLPLPSYYPASDPSSSSAASSPSAAVSVQAGPAVLSVSAASLDLSLTPQATFTISATGSGWASWRVRTAGTDLDFSPSSGVLQAGQSVEVTVSLDPSQDGLTTQVFTVAGQSVTVALPLPDPIASVVPSPVASVLPSVIPSGT